MEKATLKTFTKFTGTEVSKPIFSIFFPNSRPSHQRCPVKKLFLKVSKNSQENNCVRVSSSEKVGDWSPTILLKRGSGSSVFL